MDKPLFFLSREAEKKFRLTAMLICVFIMVVDYYFGNLFTNTAVLLYAVFMVPALLLTRAVQVRYFFHTQSPIIAFRIFSCMLMLLLLIIWGYSILDYNFNPPVFPGDMVK
ncbi:MULTISPECIES: hypothetical protein [Shewanella]|uniref:Uncharacterized protein n=2 Tax=Shewanella TaxID=22 RepID=A0A974XIP1_9GAMM|nr:MULTISPECIES: hypothetical protein [Shewanella]QSX29122.1 hypothetical protein JYB88_12840 [Shewanella cyperi]QSX36261.1 hypothetical protein JYB85_13150 [Shewanella sedimentimangrovi]QSX39868.1 hypothetical protein JYB84_12765 [Shewanella cyperi]